MNHAKIPRTTDQLNKIELPSAIQQVSWAKRIAAPAGMVGLEVITHYIGASSDIEVKLSDKSGKTFGPYKDKIIDNHYLELNHSSYQYK